MDIANGGEIRLAAGGEFPNDPDIHAQNPTATNSSIREGPCGTNTVFHDNAVVNSGQGTCWSA
ncbi:hypothetical protein ACIGNX_18540 [Actinosynnema sp. NPDC053489]|uniref:hypothetical protein n=1 Tax=Actinosynnema sp. NPDC053489 TaxID=3363916 RepID=UPI0037C625DA